MDCKLCEREIEAYLQNRLSPEHLFQMDEHLKGCESCARSLFLEKLASQAILSEKVLLPDSELPDKIMQIINAEESSESKGRVVFMIPPVIRKIAYTTSIAAAMFVGIVAGNLYLADDTIPAEMSYINDVQIEAVNLFTNEN